jgi:hypothetical protein
MSNTASNGGREVANDQVGIAVQRARRGPDGGVLAVSGLPGWSAGGVGGAGELGARAGPGRLFGLRVTWPGSRLVLFEVDAALARSLATQMASETVPVAPDETTARQLLDRRPRFVVRHLGLEQPRSARRQARRFVSKLVSA